MNIIEKQIDRHKIIMTIMYSFIFAFGLNMFLTPENILSTGLTGIAQIVSILIPVIPFGLFYFLINIPGVIIGFIFLGKKFTLYSLISVITVSVATTIIPTMGITNDVILNCLFGGIIMGYGMGGLLKYGSSTGGLDFYGMYLYQKFGINFTNLQTMINVGIILTSGFLFGIEIALYSMLALIVRQMMVAKVYTTHQKLTVWVIGESVRDVSDYINFQLGRGTNIFHNVEGGYTHNEKEVLMAILDEYEFRSLQDNIKSINSEVFMYASGTSHIGGNYQIKRKK